MALTAPAIVHRHLRKHFFCLTPSFSLHKRSRCDIEAPGKIHMSQWSCSLLSPRQWWLPTPAALPTDQLKYSQQVTSSPPSNILHLSATRTTGRRLSSMPVATFRGEVCFCAAGKSQDSDRGDDRPRNLTSVGCLSRSGLVRYCNFTNSSKDSTN